MKESRWASWRRLWAMDGVPLGARLKYAWCILLAGGLEREAFCFRAPPWIREYVKGLLK